MTIYLTSLIIYLGSAYFLLHRMLWPMAPKANSLLDSSTRWDTTPYDEILYYSVHTVMQGHYSIETFILASGFIHSRLRRYTITLPLTVMSWNWRSETLCWFWPLTTRMNRSVTHIEMINLLDINTHIRIYTQSVSWVPDLQCKQALCIWPSLIRL